MEKEKNPEVEKLQDGLSIDDFEKPKIEKVKKNKKKENTRDRGMSVDSQSQAKVKQLEEENSTLKSTIEELKKEVKKRKRMYKKIKKKKDDYKYDSLKYQGDFDTKSTDFKVLVKTCSKLTGENQTLEKLLKDQKVKVAQYDDLKTKFEELEKLNEDLKAKVEHLQTELNQFADPKDDTGNPSASKEPKEPKEPKENVTTMKKQFEDWKKECLTKHSNEITRMKSQEAKKTEELENTRRIIDEMHKNHEKKMNEMSRNEAKKIEEIKSSNLEFCNSLKQEIKESKVTVDNLIGELESFKKTKVVIEKKNRSLQKELENKENEINTQNNVINDLQIKKTENLNELDHLKQKIEDFQRMEIKIKEMETLQNTLKKENIKNEELESRLKRESEISEKRRIKIVNLIETVEELEKMKKRVVELNEIHLEIKSFKDSVKENTNREIISLKEKIEEEEEKVKDLQIRLKENENEANEIEKNLRTLVRTNKVKYENELLELKKAKGLLEVENNRLKTEYFSAIEELKEKKETESTKAEEQKMFRKSMKENLNTKIDKINKLNERIARMEIKELERIGNEKKQKEEEKIEKENKANSFVFMIVTFVLVIIAIVLLFLKKSMY